MLERLLTGDESCGVPAGLEPFFDAVFGVCASSIEDSQPTGTLAVGQGLCSLAVRDCALRPCAVVALAQCCGKAAAARAGSKPTQLTELYLDGNLASEVGAKALAAHCLGNPIATGCRLQTLSISTNCIGDAGGVSLGEALRVGPCSLTELDVGQNQLGLPAFGALLAPDTGLVRLSLFGNRVGDTRGNEDDDDDHSSSDWPKPFGPITVASLFASGALRSPYVSRCHV